MDFICLRWEDLTESNGTSQQPPKEKEFQWRLSQSRIQIWPATRHSELQFSANIHFIGFYSRRANFRLGIGQKEKSTSLLTDVVITIKVNVKLGKRNRCLFPQASSLTQASTRSWVAQSSNGGSSQTMFGVGQLLKDFPLGIRRRGHWTCLVYGRQHWSIGKREKRAAAIDFRFYCTTHDFGIQRTENH